MTDERKISDDELVEISGGADGPDVNIDESKPTIGRRPGADSADLPPSGGPGSPPDEGPIGTDGGGDSGGSSDLG
jgi:hypothetical protein